MLIDENRAKAEVLIQCKEGKPIYVKDNRFPCIIRESRPWVDLVCSGGGMTRPAIPYSLPRVVEPKLARVLAYWEQLKRAENKMPFWDDVNPSSLPGLADSLMLINVFKKPMRFRLSIIGEKVTTRYGKVTTGKFLDEMETGNPFEYLLSQCSATVESRAPTYYRHPPNGSRKSRTSKPYSRLLLPLWGDGYIGMLLVGFAWR